MSAGMPMKKPKVAPIPTSQATMTMLPSDSAPYKMATESPIVPPIPAVRSTNHQIGSRLRNTEVIPTLSHGHSRAPEPASQRPRGGSESKNGQISNRILLAEPRSTHYRLAEPRHRHCRLADCAHPRPGQAHRLSRPAYL